MNFPAVDDLKGARGKLVLFLASILQRADILPMAEFSPLLTVYAATVGETAPAEGRILSDWADVVRGIEGN
jgi:hypothetical protein